MILENIIGVQEASELWGLKPGYIKNLCAEGRIEAKKIGTVWVIDKTIGIKDKERIGIREKY